MEGLTTDLFNSSVIVALTILTLIIIQIVVHRAYRYIDSIERIRKERRQQTITFLQIITWSISVAAVCVALLMILSELGVNIAPLLASVGIAGLALSLGAQTLIKDFIGGFLILFENQYVVGDSIELDNLTGQVERITLRATYVRDVRGLHYVVPNGEIRIVANQNKDWLRALVEVNVAYGEDLDHVVSVLVGIADEFAKDPDFSPGLLDKPVVDGPLISDDWAIKMRVMVKTQPDRRLEFTQEIQKRVLEACEREGISLAYPRREVWLRERD